MKIKFFGFLVFLSLAFTYLNAQQPYNLIFNHSYQHIERDLYNSDSRFHTAIKPYLKNQTDTISNYDDVLQIETTKKIWDIVFNKSLIKKKYKHFEFSIDPAINLELGFDNDYDQKSWVNTRGIFIRAGIGDNFAMGTQFLENQAMFNDLRNDRIKQLTQRVIPGQGLSKIFKQKPNGYDYYFSDAYISYSPSKYFNFQLGTGKNFFGDGYRSLLLSDNSFNYPHFKITTDIWQIKYVNLWAQFQHLRDSRPDVAMNTKKWGAFQYLSWNVTQWLNLSLFEAVIWRDQDSIRGHRGFDIHYANPVIYLRPVEWCVGSPDNIIVGAAGKITLLKKTALYGQLVFDEFKISVLRKRDGWHGNKWGIQAGLKSYDLFSVERLDFQTELNVVRPFMYSHDPVTNYTHFNQPLAHPLGSNFAEAVTFLRYGYKRLFFDVQLIFAKHGADTANLNYGNNLFLPYSTYAQNYGNKFFQADEVNLKILNATVSFLINPAYNLNVYTGIIVRNETSSTINRQQKLIVFGIRTSLHNFYWDF